MQDFIFILEKEHQNHIDISEIKDPIIREICFLGFVFIHKDIILNKLRLYKDDKTEYRIDLFDFK